MLGRLVNDFDEEHLDVHGLSVRIAGEEASYRWVDDAPENIYSVSKGVCAIAIGIAIDEGTISLDTTADRTLTSMEFGDGAGRVTVEQLLSMTSEIDFAWFGDDPVPWPDLAQEMLRRPRTRSDAPFQYSDASTYVAMRMLGALVGDVQEWLVPRLFDPLSIPAPRWRRCPQGWIIGGSGLELKTSELARIGCLLRDGGAWEGSRVVSEEWVRRMHDPWLPTGGSEPFTHYGLATWKGPSGLWRLDGAFGQYVLVDESRNAVITITAHERERDHRLAELAAAALDRENSAR